MCSTSNLNCHLFTWCVYAGAGAGAGASHTDKLHTINKIVLCVFRRCCCRAAPYADSSPSSIVTCVNMERTVLTFVDGFFGCVFRLVVFAILIRNNYTYACGVFSVLKMHQ